MCGRYTQTSPLDLLKTLIDFEGRPNFTARYNIAPTQEAPVIAGHIKAERKPVMAMMRWGLIPKDAPDDGFAARMINARAETVARKASFAESFRYRRALVPADGFYEWRGEDGVKQPWYIHARDETPFFFAGLWSKWTRPETGEPVWSFTVITTEANDAVRDIHHRMPVMLHRREDWAAWLDRNAAPGELQALLHPFPADMTAFHPVDRAVGKVANDNPGLIEPAETRKTGTLL